MKNKERNKIKSDDYITIRSVVPAERLNSATQHIAKVLPAFHLEKQVTLADLEKFLKIKYKAAKADWKDIDSCTRKNIKRYNKYCQTVFCISECQVLDEEYYASYIIKREHCIKASMDVDDFFYDLFIIIGSKDNVHPSSFYVGGQSEGILDELFVLCGKHLTKAQSSF